MARQRHAAAHPLGDKIESGTIAERPRLAEARDRAGDDARIDLGKTRKIDFESLGHTGTEIADYDIGLAYKLIEEFQTGRLLQIDCDALLVAAERQEIGAHTVARIFLGFLEEPPRALASQRRFDFDRARAEVSEKHRSVRTRQHVC